MIAKERRENDEYIDQDQIWRPESLNSNSYHVCRDRKRERKRD